jgi:hypothetical protein
MTTVDYTQHTITHEDPKIGGDSRRAHQVREFIEADWDWRIANNLPMSTTRPTWTCVGRPLSDTPFQPCGIACGVYACGFATMHAQDIPIEHFNSTLVPRMRLHIANSILRHDCTPLQFDLSPTTTPSLQLQIHSQQTTQTNNKTNKNRKRLLTKAAVINNTIKLTDSPPIPPTTFIHATIESPTPPSSEPTTMDNTSLPTLPPTAVTHSPTEPPTLVGRAALHESVRRDLDLMDQIANSLATHREIASLYRGLSPGESSLHKSFPPHSQLGQESSAHQP